MAMAGSWVVGSMTRSGRTTTHTLAMTSTRRAIAARPAHPASSRSSHAAGLRPLPKESSLTAAVRATTYSSVPTNVRIHTERRKRTARMYSGPSGQATTISTSEPNSTARPNMESVRPSHVAPSDTSDASSTVLSSDEPDDESAGAMVVGVVEPPGVVDAVDPPAGVGDDRTAKPNWPLGPSSPLGWRTDHATLHGPVGIGVLIGDGDRLLVGAELRPPDVRLGPRVAVAGDRDRRVADRLVERQDELRRGRLQLRAVGRIRRDEGLGLGRRRASRRPAAADDRDEHRPARAAACGGEHRFGRALGNKVVGATPPPRPPPFAATPHR